MAAALEPSERLDIRLALEDLNTAFTYHLDHNEIDELVELFTEDALYTHGERRSEGRAAIAELMRRRTAGGPRTSRHLYSGLKLTIESRNRATGSSVCLSFAHDGEPPLPATPALVADFEDVYERGRDGKWRIKERHIRRVFAAPDNRPVGHG